MERKMYVLQNEDGKFYQKDENTSSSHRLMEGFENAFLFKTKKGAEQRKKLPCYSKCIIREVEIKLI